MFGVRKEIATVLALSSFPASGFGKGIDLTPVPVSDVVIPERSTREMPQLNVSEPPPSALFNDIKLSSMPSAKPFAAASSFEIAQAPVPFATDKREEVTSFIENQTAFTVLGSTPETFKEGKALAIIVVDGGRSTEKKRDEYVDAIAGMVSKFKVKAVLIEEPLVPQRSVDQINEGLKKVYTNPGQIEIVDEIRGPLHRKIGGRPPIAGGESSTDLHIELAIAGVLTVHTEALRKQIEQGDEVVLIAGNESGKRYEDLFKGIEYLSKRGGFPKLDPDKYCERIGFKSVVTKEGRELLRKDLEKIEDWVKNYRYELRNQQVAGRVSKLLTGKEPNEAVVLFYGLESVSASPVPSAAFKPGASLQGQLNQKDVNCVIVGLRDEKAQQIKEAVKVD